MPTVSIIIPALNEETGIRKTIEAIPIEELAKAGYETEVLVVDGNSRDDTAERSKEAGARVIVEPRRGYGLALRTGFDAANGDVLVSSDADHTYPVEDITKLIELMERDRIDFLSTDRFRRMGSGAMSTRNKLGNGALSAVARTLFMIPFRDSQSGMWLMKKEVWKRIRNQVKSNGMPFSQEIKIEAYRNRFRCAEKEIVYSAREGTPKLNPWRDGLGNMLHLFRKRIS